MSSDSHEKWNVADIAISFNKQVRKCIAIASSVNIPTAKGQAMIDTARRRIKLVIDADPLFLIDHIGKYLFRYRDEIHSDIDDFIANPEAHLLPEHKAEIDKAKQSGKINSDDASTVDELLAILKSQWLGYTPAEKKVVRTCIQTLLSEYCKYLVVKDRA